MIELLDEITQIPFQVFWDKYQEIAPGTYNRSRAESVWFYMFEGDRETAFEQLAKGHPAIGMFDEMYEYLEHFSMPF
jgi:hypothetical protein